MSAINTNPNMINSSKIIPMSPLEENNLIINYYIYSYIYGQFVICATDKGICYIGIGDEKEMLEELKKRYKYSIPVKKAIKHHETAIFQINDPSIVNNITFHIKGTEFQLKVWNELLNISPGQTCSYKHIAEKIGKPKAVRAVANAIGQNPVAFLIPCHRVIRSDGTLGGYNWGLDVKKQRLEHESLI